jgi:hypothetical protein
MKRSSDKGKSRKISDSQTKERVIRIVIRGAQARRENVPTTLSSPRKAP